MRISDWSSDVCSSDLSSFTAGSDMTLTQNVHVVGGNATFDTGANNVTLTGAMDGTQCLIKAGSGRLTLAAAASNDIGACVEEGTLSFNNRLDRKSVVEGKSVSVRVEIGGRRIIKNKTMKYRIDM